MRRCSAQGGIDGLAIDLRDGGDVFRRLEAAFDLETRDAAARCSARDFLHGREILRARAGSVCRRDRAVRHPRSFHRACGRPARTRRGWRCAGRAIRWSGTGRSRPRRARRGRRPPAAAPGLPCWKRSSSRSSVRGRARPGRCRASCANARPSGEVMVICVLACRRRRGVSAFDHAREAEVLHDHGIHAGRLQSRSCARRRRSSPVKMSVLKAT